MEDVGVKEGSTRLLTRDGPLDKESRGGIAYLEYEGKRSLIFWRQGQ